MQNNNPIIQRSHDDAIIQKADKTRNVTAEVSGRKTICKQNKRSHAHVIKVGGKSQKQEETSGRAGYFKF